MDTTRIYQHNSNFVLQLFSRQAMMNSGESGIDSKIQTDIRYVSEVELTYLLRQVGFVVVLGAKSKMLRTRDDIQDPGYSIGVNGGTIY